MDWCVLCKSDGGHWSLISAFSAFLVLQVSYGHSFCRFPVSIGRGWRGYQICSIIGLVCVVRRHIQLSGGLFLRVYYGLFGGKRIFELLKGQNANLYNLNLRFLGLCLSGSRCTALLSLQVQTFWPFWTVCLLLDSLCWLILIYLFFLILSIHGILSALAYLFLLYFNNVLFLLIKKKNNKKK